MNKRPQGFVIAIFFFGIVFALFLKMGIGVFAATGSPKIISYQGRLTDASGNLLGGSGTAYYFKFSIWDNATVGSGSRLWPTAAPGSSTSTVKSGVFNVNIGDTTNGYPDVLTYDFFSTSTVYLQVEVSSDNVTYETLSPRQQIGASGFSLNSNTVGGLVPGWSQNTGFVSLASSTDQVGIGATSSLAKFFVQSNAASTITELIQGAAGQTANLFQAASSSGVIYFQISNLGVASSSEFRTPSSTIGNLTVSGTCIGCATGSLSGNSTSTYVAFYSGTSTLTGNSSLTFNNTTGVLTSGTSTITALTYTNASGTNLTASGYLQAANGYITSVSSTNIGATGYGTFSTLNFTNASGTRITLSTSADSPQGNFTNVSSTNITASGYGTIATLNFTNASGTRITLSTSVDSPQGNFTSESSTNITASGYSALQGLSFTNASGTNASVSGYGLFPSLFFTNASGTNITNSGYSALQGLTFANATGTGNLNIATITISTSTAASNALLTIATSSPIFTVLSNGLIGVGTNSPSYNVHVLGNVKVDSQGTGQSVLNDVQLGATSFDTDLGQVTWMDMPVSGNVATGTVESYSAQIGGTPVLTVYSEALGGTGGVQSQRIGIGTTAPFSLLQAAGLPPQTSTSSLVLLGSNFITSGSASGTFLAANPTSTFNGDFINFQVNSSTQFKVTGAGTIISTNVSSTNVSSTNITASGYSALQGLSFTNASGTNESVTGYGSFPGLVFTNATSTGNIQSATGIFTASLNVGTTTLPTNAMFNVGTSTNILTVLANGNVGIGTTAPSSSLQVSYTNVAGSGQVYGVQITPTYNQGGSVAANTDLLVNRTETAVGTGAQRLIDLQVGGTSKFLVTNTGNVGIGTTTPAGTLDVRGGTGGSAPIILSSQSSLAGSGGNIVLNAGAGSPNGKIYFSNGANSITNGIPSSVSMIIDNLGNVEIATTTSAASNALLTIATSSPIFTVLSNGLIGIGTTAPLSLLQTAGLPPQTSSSSLVLLGSNFITGGNASGTFLAANPTSTFNGDFINFQVGSSTTFLVNSSGSLSIATGTPAAGALLTIATSTNILTVLTNGRVGIGTASPQNLLHVKSGLIEVNSSPSVLSTTPDSVNALGGLFLGNGVTESRIQSYSLSGSTYLTFHTNQSGNPSSEKMRIDSSGSVLIATTTAYSATTTLVVCAKSNCTLPAASTSTNTVAFFASTGGATTDASIIARGTITAGQADIGEYVKVVGDSGGYRAGDVLSASTSSTVSFEKSIVPYDERAAGVVTETAGIIAGGGEDVHGPVILALVGRVPVKVTDKNGPIKVGDYLTSSDIPGVAMKATEPGRVIGMALEAFVSSSSSTLATSTPQIMVFVNPHFGMGLLTDGGTMGGNVSPPQGGTGIPDQFTGAVRWALAKLGLALENGIAKFREFVAEKISTKELCIGSTCVNEDKFKALLEKNSVQPASTSPLPTSAPPLPVSQPTSSNALTPTGASTSTVTIPVASSTAPTSTAPTPTSTVAIPVATSTPAATPPPVVTPTSTSAPNPTPGSTTAPASSTAAPASSPASGTPPAASGTPASTTQTP